MRLDNYHTVYFLGIGGIGMSALARWFLKMGVFVGGYDKTPTQLTRELVSEGMIVHFEDDPSNIPQQVLNEKSKALVVYTPAIPKDHKELNFLRANGYNMVKRSEVLGMITKDYRTIAVAGTHGKTTTSSMVAHILHTSGKDMVAFLGGIAVNYASNLVIQGEINPDTVIVAEADEFDRSFLRLFPKTAVVTSADADHLDIYEKHEAVLEAFRDFVAQIKPGGELIIQHRIESALIRKAHDIQKYTYGIDTGKFHAANVRADNGYFEFDLEGFPSAAHIRLEVPGFHNVENAVAAAAAAFQYGVEIRVIQQALETFRGVKRRFEFVFRNDRVIYIDDYAHHPAEIEAFLKSVRALYPGRKLTAVFQPHLYTRTRDFAAGFSSSLSLADELILLEIYPARELPIDGVDSGMILKDVKSPHKIRTDKQGVMEILEGRTFEILVTVGAGDIDTLVEPIKHMLERVYGD